MAFISTRVALPIALCIGVAGCGTPVTSQPVPVPEKQKADSRVGTEADRQAEIVVTPPAPVVAEEGAPTPVAARLPVADYQQFLTVAAGAPRLESKAQLPTMGDLAAILPTQLTPEQADRLLITVPAAAVRSEAAAGMPQADAPANLKPSSWYRGGGLGFRGAFRGAFWGGGWGGSRFFPFGFGGLPYLAPFGLYGGLWRPFWPAFYPFGASIFPLLSTPVPVPVPVPAPVVAAPTCRATARCPWAG
jgi:hypothetical protein